MTPEAQDGGRPRPASWREIAAVLLFCCALGLVFTYPLARYASSGIPYVRFPAPGAEVKRMEPGDTLQLYYWFWLMKDNLTGGSRLFENPYEFDVTPVLPPQRYGFYQFPLSLLFVLLSPLGGAAAYNGMVVLSFGLAGGAMYLLARLYTGRADAALVAGLIFAFAPFRLAQLLGGHSNGFLFFLAPLTLYCYERGRLASPWRWGTAGGLCLVSVALTDFHLLYYLALLSAGYWSVRLVEALGLPWARLAGLARAARDVRASAPTLALAGAAGGVAGLTVLRRGGPVWHALLAAGAAAAVVLALGCLAGVAWLARAGTDDRPADAAALRRASLTLAPLALLALYALRPVAAVPGRGRLLLVVAVGGVLVGMLGALGPLAWARRARLLPLARVLLPVAVALLLAVGYVSGLRSTVMAGSLTATGGRPYSLIARNAPTPGDLLRPRNPDDERAVYPGVLPALLALAGLAGWRRKPRATATVGLYGATGLLALGLSLGPSLDPVLPLYRLAYAYVPYFNYPRSPARLMLLTFTALAVLAAWGLRRLPAGTRGTRLATLAIAAGILLDYAPFRPIGVTLLDPTDPLYATIGREAGARRFLAVPLFPGDSHQSSVYQFHVTTTRARMVNGYNPLVSRRYVEEIFDNLLSVNVGEIGPAEYDLLRRLGVGFVVVHEELFFWKVSPFPGALAVENLRASPYLLFRGRAGDRSLFEVRERPAGPPAGVSHASPVGVLLEAEELGRRTGRETPDPAASSRAAVWAAEGRDPAGSLVLGFPRFFPSGTYLAGFRLKLDAPPPPGLVAVVDVATERGRRVLARRELTGADFREPGAYEEFDLGWAIDAPGRVEFRVSYLGHGGLWADRVWVAFRDRSAPAAAYEAEALLRQRGEVRSDPEASGALAVYAAPAGAPAYPLTGPYRRYPAGRYEATFRVKLDPETRASGEVAVLDVSADRDRRQLGAARVTAETLSPPGRYHEVRVPFTLDRPAVLEFRVFHDGRAGIWIDRVAVAAAGGTS
ncbi:MAG: hypothetical protein HY359_00315 [Candidatus Rokubacteria bacterium]|nr:hypothetical protein [Candidatus Rokubacteria bacterium]